MRAYHVEEMGRIEGVRLRRDKQPMPGPTDIIIRLHAASINRRDLMILDRTYPLPGKPDLVPLSDGAGEVVAIGERVTRFKIGDRVTGNYFPRWRDGRLAPDRIDQLGCTIDGMAAEYAILDEQWAVPLPDHLSWEEGACLSCAGVTAWCSVVGSSFARPGRTVLTLGSGDVSLFAVQFAKLMGCRVIATTSEDRKAETLRKVGADEIVNYAKTPQWGSVVRELTGGEGVDVVVETMGPETIEQSLIAAARYSEIALLIWKSPGSPGLVLPATAYGPKLTTIRRLFVGPRVELEAMITAMTVHRLRPVVDKVFEFERLQEAYHYFQQRSGVGKVILKIA